LRECGHRLHRLVANKGGTARTSKGRRHMKLTVSLFLSSFLFASAAFAQQASAPTNGTGAGRSAVSQGAGVFISSGRSSTIRIIGTPTNQPNTNSGAARYESAPDPHLHRTAALGWRRRPVTQVTMVRPFHRGPRGVMGLATKPDDQRKDDCSRQNASQDNLNKRKVDHYHVSGRWRGWRPWRRRLRSHDHSCFASSLSKNLLTGLPAVLDDAGALA
jgi:hypothetical protein